jgi:CRP-like cAMP-binding protein
MSAGLVHVLREDADLADAIAIDRRAQAIEDCTARELRIPAGNWAGHAPAAMRDAVGLLVLEGLLIRRVGIDGRYGAELLGEGDVIRPWQDDDEAAMLPLITIWTVLEPSRVAMLDERFARQFARYPRLAGRLFARAVQRSRHLATNMAIVHQARVDVRLHMLFWHLAGRWGRVRSDGTALRLRLTHNVLAELVAARRPTVTSALTDLSKRGLVRYVDDVWLLSGDPPGEFVNAAAASMSSVGEPEAN